MIGEYSILNRNRGKSKTTDYLGNKKWDDIPDGITSLKKLLKMLNGKTKWLIVNEVYLSTINKDKPTKFIVEFELK